MDSAPKASLGKQLLGAAIGMGIAAALYGGWHQISTISLPALLVDTATVSDNAHQVRVSDKNLDDDSLRRIASRARQVSALQGTTETTVVESTTVAQATTAAERREERIRRFEDDGTPIAATPEPTEPVHGGAPLLEQAESIVTATPTVTSDALPNSGFGTATLAMLSLAGAAGVMRRKIFG